MKPRGIEFIAVLLTLLPLPVAASTFVLADEQALTRQSTIVVIGEVTDVGTHFDSQTGAIDTRIEIDPQEVIAGEASGGTVVLQEFGGAVGSMLQQVDGSATYSRGERVLVFARQARDGSLRTTGMAMGKYTIETADDGSEFAVRRLEEGVAVIDADTHALDTSPHAATYRLEDLLDSIRAAARGDTSHAPAPIVELPPTDEGVVEEPFSYVGAPARWLEFDQGLSVPYLVDGAGDAALGSAASLSAVQQGMAMWNSLPAARISMAYGGVMPPATGFGCTGTSTIRFNDPFDYMADPVACTGVVAISTICRDSKRTVELNGKKFNPILVAHTMFADNWGGCPNWNECSLAEVATHELGHTIGIGHSSVPGATMWPSMHSDGRCAGLRRDDVEAADFIYPTGTTNHDGVILPRNAVTVRFAATAATVTKRLSVTVKNGAMRGDGSAFQLVVARNSCPGAVVETPDFGKAGYGAPDVVFLQPGESRNAQVRVAFAAEALPGGDGKTPFRCVVGLAMRSTVAGNADPSPLNDSIDIEMNVLAKNGAGLRADTGETYVNSPAPLKMKFALGARRVHKRIPISVVNAGSGSALEQMITLRVGAGTCPAGMITGVVLNSFNGSSDAMVATGRQRSGRLELDIDPTRFTTLWANSPTRCTVSLSVAGTSTDAEPSNNATSLVIDVTDSNDL